MTEAIAGKHHTRAVQFCDWRTYHIIHTAWSGRTTPQKASQIYHYPHGFVKTYLNPSPDTDPEPMTVGYVGNLGDRLDWQLIHDVIQACPNVTFVFVGGLR